jgi:hypothetical protein
MKTLKFAMIAALIACTMVSLANTDGIRSKPDFRNVVNLNFEKAVTCQGLVTAMYQQIYKADFLNCIEPVYIAEVSFQGKIYRISGYRMQWNRFFMKIGDAPVKTKDRGPGTD